MSWKLSTKPRTVKVNRKIANEFATMTAAPSDRNLSERRLQVYRKALQEGKFRPVCWASVYCEETNEIYRVNGKHTSTLLSSLEEIPEFYAIIEEYECETLEDVQRLYATFDSKIQSRTARDIYTSFAAAVPELTNIRPYVIATAVSGMSMHLNVGHTNKMSSAAERAELLFDHTDFVLWLSRIYSSGTSGVNTTEKRTHSKHLQRQPVAAAMMGTWMKNHKAATEFWEAVRDETGVTPDTPDRKLARYLLTTGVDSGSGARRLRPVTPREMYAKCLTAWNAWRKNEPTNLRYHADKDVPKII